MKSSHIIRLSALALASLTLSVSSRAAVMWYFDGDGDGWGVEFIPPIDTSGEPEPWLWPADYGPYQGDCNDSIPWVSPGSIEVAANGVDDNCNGMTDTGPFYDAPVISGFTSGLFNATVGVPFTFDIYAMESVLGTGAGVFDLGAGNKPAGSSFSSTGGGTANVTGTFSWTPTAADVGYHKFEMSTLHASGDSAVAAAYAIIGVGIPEPSATLLLGLSGLALMVRWRR